MFTETAPIFKLMSFELRMGKCSTGLDGNEARHPGRSLQRSCRLRQDVSHSNQVVSSGSEGKDPIDLVTSSMSGFSHGRDGFHPAKDFFNSFAFVLTDLITRMPDRARIDRRATEPFHILSDMRCNSKLADRGDEATCVVSFISPERYQTFSFPPLQHCQGRISLG